MGSGDTGSWRRRSSPDCKSRTTTLTWCRRPTVVGLLFRGGQLLDPADAEPSGWLPRSRCLERGLHALASAIRLIWAHPRWGHRMRNNVTSFWAAGDLIAARL